MKVSNETPNTLAFADTKPHYALLDGLRGIAALMVLWYHVFEGFAFAKGSAIDTFNHGHLGVDFFFMLSGFVISYAYDDRWENDKRLRAKGKGSLTIWSFFKRRLIRLHPMLMMGAVIGTISFFIQGGVQWDGTHTPIHWTMLALLLTMFFIPAYPGAAYEIRGNGEMFPLNGPSWSLFFEYIGNILYALFIHRLSDKMLATLALVLGLLWTYFIAFDISGYNMIGIGWTLDCVNFFGGLLRMLFPFTIGMLMARKFSDNRQRTTDNSHCAKFLSFLTKNIFIISTIVLFVIFSVPYFPKTGTLSVNGIYELSCIIFVFPILVWFGASGTSNSVFSTKLCKFLGDISYPLYIVHYPVMYLFYAWLIRNEHYSLGETWQMVILVMTINITLAYACLKLYDEPLRRWMSKTIHNV